MNIAERLRSCDGIKSGDPDCCCEEAAAEIERLLALKTPASSQLLNITKALLDDANAEIERLRAEVAELELRPTDDEIKIALKRAKEAGG